MALFWFRGCFWYDLSFFSVASKFGHCGKSERQLGDRVECLICPLAGLSALSDLCYMAHSEGSECVMGDNG